MSPNESASWTSAGSGDLRTNLLGRVRRPGRYVGGEFNVRHKPAGEPLVVLSYPDVYEIGISNPALQILYSGINDDTPACAQRAYCPWPDMADLMRAEGVELWTLEDGRPIIYVRQVIKTWAGITVSTTHWARFLQPKRVRVVEPGKVYGWKVRPALRLHSQDTKGRADDLILSFSHSAAQAELLELLREQGFAFAAEA